MEKTKAPKIMTNEDTAPKEDSTVENGKDPIITSNPYFMETVSETFLDEDAAVNINNSEMTTTPNEYNE